MELQQHFEEVRGLIRTGQSRALKAAYTEQLSVYWQVGAYLHHRLETAEWGEKVVDQLATWLKEKEPSLKGFNRRSIYRMREFYLVWHRLDWDALRRDGIAVSVSPQLEKADSQSNIIVASVTPQFKEINNTLSSLTWTHHVEILTRTSSLEEKVFYLLLSMPPFNQSFWAS